jgi:hypothetical protein
MVCSLAGRLPTTLGFDAAGHTFMEELMKSLSEIAALYDDWANANEVSVEEILVGLDSFADDVREHQRRRADWLTAEAMALRAKAVELRTVEATMVEQLNGVCRTPKDRDHGREYQS